MDGRCMGNHSDKSAVCRLCGANLECAAKTMDRIEGIVGKELIGPMKDCRSCVYVKKNLDRDMDKCRNKAVITPGHEAFCDIERANYYGKCGREGRFWKQRPPTIWEKFKAKLSEAVLGPEENRETRRKALRELVSGPQG